MRHSLVLLPLFGLLACGGNVDDRELSAAPHVKAKSGTVWRNDIMQGLSLNQQQVCLELGLYDCIDDAHRIAMGGVDPERLGIDVPLERPPSSAPIAFDRAAINACQTRYTLDTQGSPAIFGAVLASNTEEARSTTANLLVQRILARDATSEERTELAALYDTIAPLSQDPVTDWSIGACVVVATSLEALFY